MDPTFVRILVCAGYNLGAEYWILENAFPTSFKRNESMKKCMRSLARIPLSLFDLCQFRTARLLGWNFEALADSLPIPTYLQNVLKHTGP
jgi:hypothetical protein